MSVTRPVPCGACTLCCRGEVIQLHPEDGDDVRSYKTRKIWSPLHNKEIVALERKADGDTCVYLREPIGGCSIWERRPAICRAFDCRDLANRITRQKVVSMGSNGDTKVWDRGYELRHTLAEDDNGE